MVGLVGGFVELVVVVFVRLEPKLELELELEISVPEILIGVRLEGLVEVVAVAEAATWTAGAR